MHGGFSLGLVCNNAIPFASERAETTTIALCKASTDSLTSWKMTPNSVINNILLHCGIQLLWSLVNFAPKSISILGLTQLDPREQLGNGNLEPPKGLQLQSRGRGHKGQPCVVINAQRRASCEESMNFTFAFHTSMASV